MKPRLEFSNLGSQALGALPKSWINIAGRGVSSPAKCIQHFESASPAREASLRRHVHRVNAVALAALNDLQIQKIQGKSGTNVERTTLFIRSVQKVRHHKMGRRVRSDQVPDLTQVSDGRSKCKGGYCSHGPLAIIK